MTEAVTEQSIAPTTGPTASTSGRSEWNAAWVELRHKPIFWISAVLIVIFVAMAVAPGLFTRTDPQFANLADAYAKPSAQHIFGMDAQGRDVYSRTIHGARAALSVGVLATIATTVIGMIMGLLAGFFGSWVDAVLQRLGEIFFTIPLLLGGILFLYKFPPNVNSPLIIQVLRIVFILAVLGWPQVARLMRGAVLQVKPSDYVQAARALGARPSRIIFNHILPNAIAPVIVVATINLGVYIATEATLSFLGIGLQDPAISWGGDISDASGLGAITAAPHMLLFPSLFLSLTVLAFILLGDAVRDAFDPKLR